MRFLLISYLENYDLVPHLKSGRVLATIDQRPEAQGRVAFEALHRFLVDGRCPPPRIKLNPHIVMRSNLELFLDRIAASSRRGRSRANLMT